jgi:outer membrane protein insertion porin family
MVALIAMLALTGCRGPFQADRETIPFGRTLQSSESSSMPFASNVAQPETASLAASVANQEQDDSKRAEEPNKRMIVRGQDPQPGSPTYRSPQQGFQGFQGLQPTASQTPSGSAGQSTNPNGSGQPAIYDESVRQATYQYPELNTTTPANPLQIPSPRLGAPNEMYPGPMTNAPSGVGTFPQNYADLYIDVAETRTGRVNIGGAYNSDNGLVGQFTIDERNFDIMRYPRSWREVTDGVAWRGAGQGFRMELIPGNQLQRYLVSFTEPYLFDTQVSLSVSGFLFDRAYFDWKEQRLGGRVALGYRLTPDLSISAAVRMEDVDIYDPRVNTSTQLNESVGSTDLFMGQVSLVSDTRDHPFVPTSGNYLSLSLGQAFGEVSFPRADIEHRTYRLLYERLDGSGRHTISHSTRLGFSGSSTPIFENYFAGGFSTMRGFSFRGVGPTETGVRVGGEFQILNTLEYMFPLTADDMIKGVVFVDYGTIEEDVRIDWDNFRVAPGFGFRVHMPAAGLGAPLAFDFAFPVARAANDDLQMFSFYMGVIR